MNHAIGDYIIFLDADDVFAEEMLSKACNRAVECDADIVIFGGNAYYSNSGVIKPADNDLKINLLPVYEPFSWRGLKNTNFFSITCPAPWNKLYKEEISVI